MNGDVENLSVGPIGTKVEHHPISTKDQARLHQFGKKVLSSFFLGYAENVGGSWKGYILVASVDELQENSEVSVKATEVLMPKEEQHFIFPSANGTVSLARKGPEVRTYVQIGQDTEGGEEHRSDLHGETDEPDSATTTRTK